MPTFEIPDGPTTIEAPRSGAKPAEASATYSVTNTSTDAMDGRLGVRVSGASKDEWFTIDGNRERTFGPGETQTATIRATFPSNVPAGEYPFRLRAIAVNDPDNDHVEGPMTTARLGPGEGEGKKSLLWLWILLALLAIAVIGGGAWYMLKQPKTPPPPPSPAQPAALDDAQAKQLAEKKTGEWIAALFGKDVDGLVEMSDTPFWADGGLLFSKTQLREKYSQMLRGMGEAEQKIQITKMESMTIGELKKKDPNPRGADALRLKDDDIIVIAFFEHDASGIYFRRSARDVKLAGFTG
jgi:hypothetical protein